MTAIPAPRPAPVHERHDLSALPADARRSLAGRILPEARMRHHYRDGADLDGQLLAPRGGPATLHLFSVARTPLAWLVTHELVLARIGRDLPVLYVDLGMRPGAGQSGRLARCLAAAALSFRLRRGGRSWLMLRPTWPAAFAWSRRLMPGATPGTDARVPPTAWHLRDTLVPALNLLSPLSGRSFACRAPRQAPQARWSPISADVPGAAHHAAAVRSARSPTATDGATVLTLQRLHGPALLRLLWTAGSAPDLDPAPATRPAVEAPRTLTAAQG